MALSFFLNMSDTNSFDGSAFVSFCLKIHVFEIKCVA